MRRFDTLIFDLDGTLIDSEPGVLNCFEKTLRELGLSPLDEPKKVLGPPLTYTFGELCGLDEEQTADAIARYRKRYREEGIFDASRFGGVEEMLTTLKDSGLRLTVATCKLEKYAKLVLEHFGIAHYFEFIGGADEGRIEKSQVIAHTLEELGVKDTSRVLMIGDRDNDILGAKAVGIPCLYALWGYGSAEEAEQCGALAIAKTPQEVIGFVMRNA